LGKVREERVGHKEGQQTETEKQRKEEKQSVER